MQISSIGANNKPNNSKIKKYVLIGLIASFILLIILLVLLVLYSSMTPQKLTLVVDGNATQFKEDVFIFNDNKLYVSLEDIAGLIGYRYYKGGHKEYSQNNTACSLENDDESAVYELGKNKIYKILNDGNEQYAEFDIAEPVKENNGKLYCLSSDLMIGCNMIITYNKGANQITITTLSNLYNTYNGKATAKEYPNVEGLDENFVNKKTIVYGMLVAKGVVKGNPRYGVISLDGKQTYLDIKYEEITFVENLQQFIVKGDNKYGVISKDGTQIIKPEYDKIQILDSINNLYYAEKNDKKGILDKDGKVLGGNLYVEYDELGVDKSLFKYDDIKNSKILYDKCIPVKKGEKWGLFNIEGQLIADFNLDGLGYVDSKNGKSNILLIDKLEGIVVSKSGKYGVISSEGKLLVACVFDKIYSEIVSGEEKYYLQFGNSAYELESYIETTEKAQEQNDEDNSSTMEDEISSETSTDDEANENSNDSSILQDDSSALNNNTASVDNNENNEDNANNNVV